MKITTELIAKLIPHLHKKFTVKHLFLVISHANSGEQKGCVKEQSKVHINGIV